MPIQLWKCSLVHGEFVLLWTMYVLKPSSLFYILLGILLCRHLRFIFFFFFERLIIMMYVNDLNMQVNELKACTKWFFLYLGVLFKENIRNRINIIKYNKWSSRSSMLSKTVFLKISQYSQENTCAWVSL